MVLPPNGDGASADVTSLLRAWREGDGDAEGRLFALLHAELRRIAAIQLRRERAGHTLQPTAVVHEAFLRLLPQRTIAWRDRAHFFAIAATMMRRVLVDHARTRSARKRRAPGDGEALTVGWGGAPSVELLDLDRALSALEAEYVRQARVVELRYFGGLEIDEIAVCLDISTATVKRDWQFARAWLGGRLASAAAE